MKLAYEKMVEELKLRDSSRTEPINSEMALSLIHICDEKLDNADFDKLINGNGVFSNYVYNNRIICRSWRACIRS